MAMRPCDIGIATGVEASSYPQFRRVTRAIPCFLTKILIDTTLTAHYATSNTTLSYPNRNVEAGK